jgi:hypothetical protein
MSDPNFNFEAFLNRCAFDHEIREVFKGKDPMKLTPAKIKTGEGKIRKRMKVILADMGIGSSDLAYTVIDNLPLHEMVRLARDLNTKDSGEGSSDDDTVGT